MFTAVGIPDIIGCIDGKFFAIEVKAERGITSEAQKIQIELIKDAGGIAFVAKSVDEVKQQIY